MSRYSGGRPEAGERPQGPGAGVTGSKNGAAVTCWDSPRVSGGCPEAGEVLEGPGGSAAGSTSEGDVTAACCGCAEGSGGRPETR